MIDRIRVVDFETDGTEPPAKVIEVGWCDAREYIGGAWEVEEPASYLCGGGTITAETRAVHHIAPREVAGLEPFDADGFVSFARGESIKAIAAHHADFEAKWLRPAMGDLPLICTYKAALRVWPDAPAHNNQVLRYWLEERGLTKPDFALTQPAHRAAPDAYATAWLLSALLKHATVDELIRWTAEPAALVKCPIGKYRGAKWADVDASYLSWMVGTREMDADLKWNAQRELQRRAKTA
jgi:exodeoxyribonuclease X